MNKFPFFVKASLLLVGLYLLTSILYRLQDILLPIIYAMIISILASPIINYLVKKKINRTIAIAGVLIAFLLIISCIILLVISQASMLTEALPRLSSKFQLLLKQGVSWASDYFNISVKDLQELNFAGHTAKQRFLSKYNFA